MIRILLFCLVVITALFVLTYFQVHLEDIDTTLPFFFSLWIISLTVAHLGLAYYTWVHARRCSNRFMGIPPWVWGTVVLSMGVFGGC
ncbi:MAG: hypothetical protein SVY53_01075 [Chloroflexota bacterium]|nr:hypothetical protein [Chloroflexota bacterium]